MKTFYHITHLKEALNKHAKKGSLIGFVPTMGSLHNGHMNLVKKSLLETDVTICSIYINPTQFNNSNDLQNYPQNHNDDLEKLQNIGCNIAFIPNNSQMYGNKLKSNKYQLGECLSILEGEKRPGHFDGMLTIVEKLFIIVQPNKAYFGIKDFQQLWIIKHFISKINSSIMIREVQTVRDNSGLALSSRNQQLTNNELISAQKIFKALTKFKLQVNDFFCLSQGEIQHNQVKKYINHAMININKDAIIKLDYFEVIDIENFSFAKRLNKNKQYRALIAAYVGETRLIDNILI